MNKAFVKEQEVEQNRCPACDSSGHTVSEQAFTRHVLPHAQNRTSQPAYFCPHPQCDVVYFDQFGRSVNLDSVRRPIFPKDAEAAICACFGLTRDEVEKDVEEGVVTRCRGLVEKSKSGLARCSELAPDGRSCVPEMQRYYMKYRQSHSRTES